MGIMASSCAEWKPNEVCSASWKRGYVDDYPRTVMGTEDPDLNEAPLSHPHCGVCASERSWCEDLFLLFMGTTQLSTDCAEMMKVPEKNPKLSEQNRYLFSHPVVTFILLLFSLNLSSGKNKSFISRHELWMVTYYFIYVFFAWMYTSSTTWFISL